MEATFTYEPALIGQPGKDKMRFELGDFMVDEPNERYLSDEEITAVIEAHPKSWKRAKLALVESFDKVLSLDLIGHAKALAESGSSVDAELEAFINDAIARRAEAKKAKDFATADAIRDELLAKGVEIKDTREGVVWKLI